MVLLIGTLPNQRRPRTTESPLSKRPQREREPRKTAESTLTLHIFFSIAQPAIHPSPTISTNERKQQERPAAIMAPEKKLASKNQWPDSNVCVISYLYPATCSLKGYGSGSAAAEAAAVVVYIHPFIQCQTA